MVFKNEFDEPEQIFVFYPFAKDGKKNGVVNGFEIMAYVGFERIACDGITMRLSLSLLATLPFAVTLRIKWSNLSNAASVPFPFLFAKVSQMKRLSKIGAITLQIA